MKKYTNVGDQRTYDNIAANFTKGEDAVVNEIIDAVSSEACEHYLNAAYGGALNDGGASNLVNKLKAFLDGIKYAKTGKSETFQAIIQDAKNKQDAEYQEYLRLQKKFGNKEPAAFSN